MRLAISAQRKINNKNNKAEVFSTKNNSHLSNLQQSDSFDELLFVCLHLRSLVLCNLLLLPHPIHSLLFIQLVCSIWYISILALFTKKRRNGSFFFLFKYFVWLFCLLVLPPPPLHLFQFRLTCFQSMQMWLYKNVLGCIKKNNKQIQWNSAVCWTVPETVLTFFMFVWWLFQLMFDSLSVSNHF